MLADFFIKQVVDDNITFFSNTAHACTSAWCAQHSSTAAAQLSFISPEPRTQQARTEFS